MFCFNLCSGVSPEPVLRVLAQPVFAWLFPRQPLLLAFGYLMEVPCYECDDAKRSSDEKDKDDYKKSSATSRGSCVPGAERMVMVVVDFDSSVAARIGGRICINYNSFVTLLLLVSQVNRIQRLLTAMLRLYCVENDRRVPIVKVRSPTSVSALRVTRSPLAPRRARDFQWELEAQHHQFFNPDAYQYIVPVNPNDERSSADIRPNV